MIFKTEGTTNDQNNGYYVIENSRLCLNGEELEEIKLPRLTKKEREFYDKIANCTQLGALTLVYDWRNAGMIDLYELEHLIVAIVKGGYND